jgi:hypothetical protein
MLTTHCAQRVGSLARKQTPEAWEGESNYGDKAASPRFKMFILNFPNSWNLTRLLGNQSRQACRFGFHVQKEMQKGTENYLIAINSKQACWMRTKETRI